MAREEMACVVVVVAFCTRFISNLYSETIMDRNGVPLSTLGPSSASSPMSPIERAVAHFFCLLFLPPPRTINIGGEKNEDNNTNKQL